ncbi:tricarboxylate transport protein [Aureobasidium pullulans]|uniref:Tricarboxylate transport protein n=1 Tax=Aureobasidium pullulans TaxID=5580 RepID=A0A4S9UBK8_AURPU|nr:tricarboxylate transport protein [Aureobasidium pullulans]THZ34786.1 tricarboxylate transport protein [Aureobasidium pullulans]THZ56408.1 tricarboxylate transport protein [Aureobasidium pullulans]
MDKKQSTSTLTSILAGGLAGASETVITYPAEFVKTRRQLEVSSKGFKPSSSLTILRSTIANHGLSNVYSGCQTLATSNAIKSGVRFFSFETSKRYLTRVSDKNNTSINVAAGLCAGVTESMLVVTPGESLKTRVIHDASSGGNLGKQPLPGIVSEVVKREGVLSLWKGLTPVLCKQGTNSAVRFATFNEIRDRLKIAWPEKMGGTTATLVAGAGSGVLTVYASMPFDNIKTRMQSIGNTHTGMIHCAMHMAKTEGVKVFWKATTPRLVRLTLSSSITFMLYDHAVSIMNNLTADKAELRTMRQVA